MNGSISSSVASQPSPAPSEPAPERRRYSLSGPSRAYDPARQAIRPDLADIAEAHHHFAPHYAKPLAFEVIAPTRLTSERGDAGVLVAELAPGDCVMVLDVTGGCCWGYDCEKHRVGYVPRSAMAPRELNQFDNCA